MFEEELNALLALARNYEACLYVDMPSEDSIDRMNKYLSARQEFIYRYGTLLAALSKEANGNP